MISQNLFFYSICFLDSSCLKIRKLEATTGFFKLTIFFGVNFDACIAPAVLESVEGPYLDLISGVWIEPLECSLRLCGIQHTFPVNTNVIYCKFEYLTKR